MKRLIRNTAASALLAAAIVAVGASEMVAGQIGRVNPAIIGKLLTQGSNASRPAASLGRTNGSPAARVTPGILGNSRPATSTYSFGNRKTVGSWNGPANRSAGRVPIAPGGKRPPLVPNPNTAVGKIMPGVLSPGNSGTGNANPVVGNLIPGITAGGGKANPVVGNLIPNLPLPGKKKVPGDLKKDGWNKPPWQGNDKQFPLIPPMQPGPGDAGNGSDGGGSDGDGSGGGNEKPGPDEEYPWKDPNPDLPGPPWGDNPPGNDGWSEDPWGHTPSPTPSGPYYPPADPGVSGSVAVPKNVLPPVSTRGIVLLSPAKTGKPSTDAALLIRYLVDGKPYRMPAGYQQKLAQAGRIVEFDRGGSFGRARYRLDEGTYFFAVTKKGWDLFRKTFKVTVDNRANQYAFRYLVDNRPATVAPGQTRTHTGAFAIEIVFDRGNGGQPVRKKLNSGVYEVRLDPAKRLLDLQAATVGNLASN